jgi:hypothetical protein
MKQEISSKIIKLHRDSLLLKNIHEIRKILLSNGAYSNSNMELQNITFEKKNIPEWEKNSIVKSWNATKKLSNEMFKDLDELSDFVLNENKKELIQKDEINVTNILKKKAKEKIDNL